MQILEQIQEALRRYFLLRWVLANILGWSIGLGVGLTIGASIGQWLGVPLFSLILAGALAGVIVGAFQHLALQDSLDVKRRRWIGWSAFGGALGAFPAFLLSFTLIFGWHIGAAVMGAMFAGILSALQSLNLREQPDQAWSWVMANVVAGGLCGACSVLVALPVVPLICSAGPPLFGLVTGLVLTRYILIFEDAEEE